MEPGRLQLSYRFGIVLVLGLFVGLQREYAYRERVDKEGELLAGARTFPLIALLDAVAALAAAELEGAWPFTTAVIAMAILLAVGHSRQSREREMGLTTEIAALVTSFTGALCYWGSLRSGAAVGVGTAVPLSLKVQTHSLARSLTVLKGGRRDRRTDWNPRSASGRGAGRLLIVGTSAVTVLLI
jgi:uncharacterized membrane protein YhiD involved in acid resistance